MDQTFVDFFQVAAPTTVLITSHENADPDALCSAVAIAYLIELLHPEVETIVSFDGVNVLSQKIIEEFKLDVRTPNNNSSDATIIVDANSAEQVGSLKNIINWKQPVLVIDHHVSSPNTAKIAQSIIIAETAVATTELIHELFRSLDVKPSKKIASLLFIGLLYDSRHLLLATNKTINIVNELLALGANYSELVVLLTVAMDRPERIARLKAAQRLTLHEFNRWLVVISHTSAYEASACRALIRLGADVALVYGQTKEGIRFSSRATAEVARETHLNLASDIMEKIGSVMHGEGGGHNTAAGCSGKDNLEAGLELALKLIEKKLIQK